MPASTLQSTVTAFPIDLYSIGLDDAFFTGDGRTTVISLLDNSITAAKIAPDAVTASELADNAVDTAAIVDLAVTGAKMEDTGVVAATYTFATVTVDAKGRITSASSGTPTTTFLGLTDAPAAYTGEAGKAVVVNGTETGVEFATITTTDTYVASGAVAGTDLTLTMNDASTVVVDVTSLLDNVNVASGAVAGTDLTLTLSDASTVVVDVTNLVPPTAANAIPPAADDATGAIGTTTTEFALEDHKHPAQAASVTPTTITGANYITDNTDTQTALTELDTAIAAASSSLPTRKLLTGANGFDCQCSFWGTEPTFAGDDGVFTLSYDASVTALQSVQIHGDGANGFLDPTTFDFTLNVVVTNATTAPNNMDQDYDTWLTPDVQYYSKGTTVAGSNIQDNSGFVPAKQVSIPTPGTTEILVSGLQNFAPNGSILKINF